jgi:hypothetical protein
MQSSPYITEYVNEIFDKEKARLDYRFLRPVLNIVLFLLRIVLVPIKFVLHRRTWGFEKPVIDAILAYGIRRFASTMHSSCWSGTCRSSPRSIATCFRAHPRGSREDGRETEGHRRRLHRRLHLGRREARTDHLPR